MPNPPDSTSVYITNDTDELLEKLAGELKLKKKEVIDVLARFVDARSDKVKEAFASGISDPADAIAREKMLESAAGPTAVRPPGDMSIEEALALVRRLLDHVELRARAEAELKRYPSKKRGS